VTSFLCKTCGTQFPPSDTPPDECPICCDERQYVPSEGQQWVTYQEVCDTHHAEIRDELGITGIGLEPEFAIGQRALLVGSPSGNVLWDCLPLLDEMAAFVESRGGLRAIAISHPHFYSTMVEWAERFECPILLHKAEREFVVRPHELIEFWSGEVRELWDDLRLLRLGGHFDGAEVLHRPGAIFTGDVVAVRPGERWVSWMRSYPMLIPLPAREVERIAAALEPWDFDRIYGGWWGSVVTGDAKEIVRRSAERYARAVS
jgi:hypothetical protein